MNQLLEILKAEGRRILDEFELASEQGDGTPQEIADFRENAVQDFISRFYPTGHVVSKGKVTDLEGHQSNSIDCLLLNPAHPKLVDAKGKFRLIFADGCDAAVEVKPNLARTDELQRALDQGISLKKVKRSKSALLWPKGKSPHILEHSLYIPFYIFAIKSFDPLMLYKSLSAYYKQSAVAIEHQIDGVFIINSGILRNVKHREHNFYGAAAPLGQSDGWYFEAWGESTPLGVLMSLEYSFSSFPGVAESIMKRAPDRRAPFANGRPRVRGRWLDMFEDKPPHRSGADHGPRPDHGAASGQITTRAPPTRPPPARIPTVPWTIRTNG